MSIESVTLQIKLAVCITLTLQRQCMVLLLIKLLTQNTMSFEGHVHVRERTITVVPLIIQVRTMISINIWIITDHSTLTHGGMIRFELCSLPPMVTSEICIILVFFLNCLEINTVSTKGNYASHLAYCGSKKVGVCSPWQFYNDCVIWTLCNKFQLFLTSVILLDYESAWCNMSAFSLWLLSSQP